MPNSLCVTMNIQKIAANKILPINVGNVLERERLFTLLRQDSPTNAFWISGPGGSGKTTLVANYLEREKLPCLWYQFDAMDGDPATFFYYLGQAASSFLVPDEPPMPLLTPEYHPNIEVFILRYFETMYHRIKTTSWIVFDNFQDAPQDSAFSHILAAAVKKLPAHIRLAIISRSAPPPDMSWLIANRIMHPIGWNQLAFTPDEFAAFLDFSGSRIGAGDADRLFQLTKGWIAGTILWLLDHSGHRAPSVLPEDQTPENIFDYFAAEILEKAPVEIRHFLLQTALLPHMTIDMADELTGMETEKILEYLHKKNFFIEKRRLPNVSYQYHPLFRRFLLLQTNRIFSPDTLRTLRRHAAAILEHRGRPEEAIGLYRQTDDFEAMQTIIVSSAQALVDQGRYAVLSARIDALPKDYPETRPWLMFWKAISQSTSNPQASSLFCVRAYEMFTREQDVIGQVLSWSAVVEILMMLRGGFYELDRWILEGDRLGKLLPEGEKYRDITGRFASGMLLALLLRNQGHPDLEKWQILCESLLDQCRDRRVVMDLIKNLCWSYQCLGQKCKSQMIAGRLKLLQTTENLQPLQQILSNVLFALLCFNIGDLQECLRMVKNATDQADETGIHVFDFMALAYNVYCVLGAGELSQVPSYLERLKAALAPYAVWDRGQYHYLSAWYAMQTGDLIAAHNQLETAFSLVESCGNPFTLAFCHILQSQVFLETGALDKAENLLKEIVNEPRLGQGGIIHFLVNLAFAGCAFTQKRVNEAQQYCRAAFSFAREEGAWAPFGLSNRSLRMVCARALEARVEEDAVIEFIKRWRLKPPDTESMNEGWPWPVRVYVLGGFEINHDGKPLALSAKTPKKPLELLSLLICAGRAGIFREAAAGELWPDSNGDRAIQNLNTTLHRLRKLLGDDEAVVQQGGQLSINGDLCWVDCWQFQQQVRLLESSLAHLAGVEQYLTQALALYRGPFAAGHQHLSTTVGYSSQLHTQWLSVLAIAVQLFVTTDMETTSRRAVQQALAADETAAAVFPIVVRTFSKSGKKIEAMDILYRCRRLLAEQGIEFGPKTVDFFSNFPGNEGKSG